MSEASTPLKPKENKLRLSRAAELAIGYTGNFLLNEGFDYILYPYVIYKLGLVAGGVVMAMLSLIACLLTLWFYDWSKRDWLGIEAFKEIKVYSGKSKFRCIISTALRHNDWLACLLLSIKFDPFITTAYLRRGSFNGMQWRDVKIFLASWAVGNMFWSLICCAGTTGTQQLWNSLNTN